MTGLQECVLVLLQFCSIIDLHYNLSFQLLFIKEQDSILWPNIAQKKASAGGVCRSFSSPLYLQLDPAAGEKGHSVVAGGMRSAARVAQWPDGWFANMS